jgi:hypothetical protein
MDKKDVVIGVLAIVAIFQFLALSGVINLDKDVSFSPMASCPINPEQAIVGTYAQIAEVQEDISELEDQLRAFEQCELEEGSGEGSEEESEESYEGLGNGADKIKFEEIQTRVCNQIGGGSTPAIVEAGLTGLLALLKGLEATVEILEACVGDDGDEGNGEADGLAGEGDDCGFGNGDCEDGLECNWISSLGKAICQTADDDCTSDYECTIDHGANYLCIANSCTEVACQVDEDCSEGESCVSNSCIPLECDEGEHIDFDPYLAAYRCFPDEVEEEEFDEIEDPEDDLGYECELPDDGTCEDLNGPGSTCVSNYCS